MSMNVNGGGLGSLFSKVGEMVNKAVEIAKDAAAKATQAPPPEKPDNSNAQYFQGKSTYEQPKFNDLVYHPGQDEVHMEKIGTKNSTSGGGDSGSTMI